MNISVTQIVQITRLPEPDDPLEMIYFVEGANGERLPAVTTADLLNRLDVQHAAILLGYRIQGILAQRKYHPQNNTTHYFMLLCYYALCSLQAVFYGAFFDVVFNEMMITV